jgi:hypothetical protein
VNDFKFVWHKSKSNFAKICRRFNINCKADGTPKKLATAISENCYQPELNMLLNGVAQIEETATQFSQFALLHSVTRVQLRLITVSGNCGFQFPWCALALSKYLFQHTGICAYKRNELLSQPNFEFAPSCFSFILTICRHTTSSPF